MATRIVFQRSAFIFVIIMVALMIAGGLVLIYLPKADVVVHTLLTPRTVEQEITLSSSIEDPDFVRFRLPAQIISAEVATVKTITRDASTQFDDFAKGEIVLINEQPEIQELLPNTHLRHEETGRFFLTDTPVAIPAQGEIRMTITAKEKGAQGNVPAGRFIIDKLAPSLQSRIYGRSDVALTGGVAVETPVTEAELNEAREEIVTQARDEARALLTAKAGGAPLRDDLIAVTEENITSSAEVGSKALAFEVAARVTVKAFLVDETDLLSLTALKLRETAEAEEEFVNYDPLSFNVQLIRSDFKRGEALVRGSLKGLFATKVGPTAFSNTSLAGLSADEVRERLQQFPGVGDVDVTFSPFWVRTVPSRAGAVTITITSD